MRLLFATSIRTWGGGEEWMRTAAAGLADRGHAAELLAPAGSAIAERAAADGLRVSTAPFAADLDVVSFARTFAVCRRLCPDAMVLNMDRVLRVGGTAARLAGVPVVLPRRGSEFPLKDGALYRFTYRRVATGMIVNSRATAETLVRRIAWRPAGRVHVLPNHVDVDRFADPAPRTVTRRALGLPGDAAVLITVGELTTRKSTDLVVRQLPRLARERDVRLLVVGQGAEEEAWRALARDLGVADRVRFLGFRSDVPDLLAASDVLVHPARVEGFGYAVAEAMAAGLPVVATNASSLPELVEDGGTGLLFPPGDGDALAAALETYLADPERRRRDGERGRERATREFALARRLDELERLLEQEISATRRG